MTGSAESTITVRARWVAREMSGTRAFATTAVLTMAATVTHPR
jgi:hypothetical protein